jgi:YVTN family beta-propeller protein
MVWLMILLTARIHNQRGFDSLVVISDSTNTAVADIPVGRQPVGIAYDSATEELFVTNHASDSVAVISAGTMRWLQRFLWGTSLWRSLRFGHGRSLRSQLQFQLRLGDFRYSKAVVATVPVRKPTLRLSLRSDKGEVYVGHANCFKSGDF